jgi:hypothetical protein
MNTDAAALASKLTLTLSPKPPNYTENQKITASGRSPLPRRRVYLFISGKTSAIAVTTARRDGTYSMSFQVATPGPYTVNTATNPNNS